MTTAVLLDAQVFIAENNIRRNVATFRANAQSTDGSAATRDANVADSGGVFTYTSIPDNSMTIIKTSKPLVAEVNLGATQFTITINSVFVMSDEVTEIVFTNNGTEIAQLLIVQV